MDQDLAVRLANEGVPVQAIARATGTPSTNVREQLATALLAGDLMHLPCNDWPSDQRNRRPAWVVVDDKQALEAAARRLYRLSPMQARMLLILLQADEVSREHLQLVLEITNAHLTVQILLLRRKLPYTIQMYYGHGYAIPGSQRREILTLLKSSQPR